MKNGFTVQKLLAFLFPIEMLGELGLLQSQSFRCMLLSDIDECALGTDNCDPNATCNNTKDAFNCTCNAGFAGNGTYCHGRLRDCNSRKL